MEPEEKIELILDWAKSHSSFDTEFVESVLEYFEEHYELTDAQDAALDNIIEKFGIGE